MLSIFYMKFRNDLVGPRSVHRKALLKALADELPPNSIRFASKLTAIKTQEHEGSSISVIHLGDGTIIKAKVYCNQNTLFISSRMRESLMECSTLSFSFHYILF